MDIAEARLGRPAHCHEICTVLEIEFYSPIPCGPSHAIIQNLYREDFFYADKMFNHYSTNKNGKGKETMELFSERFLRLYPGY